MLGVSFLLTISRKSLSEAVKSVIITQNIMVYKIVCENCVVSRETLRLAGRFEKIDYTDLEITNISAAWRYIDKRGGKIEAKSESRVRDVTGM